MIYQIGSSLWNKVLGLETTEGDADSNTTSSYSDADSNTTSSYSDLTDDDDNADMYDDNPDTDYITGYRHKNVVTKRQPKTAKRQPKHLMGKSVLSPIPEEAIMPFEPTFPFPQPSRFQPFQPHPNATVILPGSKPHVRPEALLLNNMATRDQKPEIVCLQSTDIHFLIEEKYEKVEWKDWCKYFDISGRGIDTAEVLMRFVFSALFVLWWDMHPSEAKIAVDNTLSIQGGIHYSVWVLEPEFKGLGRALKRCVDRIDQHDPRKSKDIASAVKDIIQLYKKQRIDNPVGALTRCNNSSCMKVIKNGPERTKSNCSKCQQVAYCSKACQTLDWPIHKEFCRCLSFLKGKGSTS